MKAMKTRKKLLRELAEWAEWGLRIAEADRKECVNAREWPHIYYQGRASVYREIRAKIQGEK